METILIDLGIGVGGILVGLLPLAVTKLRTRPRPMTEHEHDWHIGGKDAGRVRYECGCGEVRHS